MMFWKKKPAITSPEEPKPQPTKELNLELVVFAKTNMVKVFAETKKIEFEITDAIIEQYRQMFWKELFARLKSAIENNLDTVSYTRYAITAYMLGAHNAPLDTDGRLFESALPVIIADIEAAGIPYEVKKSFTGKTQDDILSFNVVSLAKYCDAEKHSLLI